MTQLEWTTRRLGCGLALTVLALAASMQAQAPPPAESPLAPAGAATTAPPAPAMNRVRPPHIPRPGLAKAGVSRPLEDLQQEAVFPVEGSPDWSVVTKDAVWVASARANHVVQLLAASNKVGLIADVQRPCSGLAEGFGSVWVPSCATHSVIRLDPETAKTVAEIPADPANSEGGITVGDGSVWMVIKPSTLVRIDPETNSITGKIELPSGSENPLFYQGFVWISSFDHDQLLKVDPKKNLIVESIPVGPKPRFLTAGADSVWTLNQGDGSVSRVDVKTGKLTSTIACGIPGTGGEITFGAGSVWAAVFDFPLTQIDAKSNTVVKQWGGQGGDGIRFGLGSVWLSNLRQGNVWRLSPEQK